MKILLIALGLMLVLVLDKDWSLASLWNKNQTFGEKLDGYINVTRHRLNGHPLILVTILLTTYTLFSLFAKASEIMIGHSLYSQLAVLFIFTQVVDLGLLLHSCSKESGGAGALKTFLHKLSVTYSALFLLLSIVLLLVI